MPRPPGAQTRGCYIERTPGGRIRICFRLGSGTKQRLYRITTELWAKNPADMDRAIRARDLVAAEIRAGIFDPAKRFPSYFSPKLLLERSAPDKGHLSAEIDAWITRIDRPSIRRSRIRNYRNDLKYVNRHPISKSRVSELGHTDFLDFQKWLTIPKDAGGAGLSEKTAANIIRGTIRAFLRDTDRPTTVLDKLRWERTAPTRRQDPFEPRDCTAILDWFEKRRPLPEYVSIALRTEGVTPSETRGLEVGDFSRRDQAVTIARSQYGGDVGATKAWARERTVLINDRVAKAVAKLCGIRKPNEIMIGVKESHLIDVWARALTALGIRYRSVYQLKHSYAVNSLEQGEPPSSVARNLGISLSTLERHYAASIKRRTEPAGRKRSRHSNTA